MDPSEKRKLFNKYCQQYKRLKSSKPTLDEEQPSTSRVSLDSYDDQDSSSEFHYSSLDTDSEIDSEIDDLSEEHIFDESENQNYSQNYIETLKNNGSEVQEKPFITQLLDWVLSYNINHKAFSSLLQILKKYGIDVPKDARTILKTPRNTGSLINAVEPGFYYHFGLEKSLQNLINRLDDSFSDNILNIFINVDGLPLSKSSGSQLWPIMISLLKKKNIVEVCGLYQGNEKPKIANQFISKFVSEAIDLITNGLIYNNINYEVKIVGFICDVPAKAFIKCTRGHSGYMSCSKCDTEGVFKCNRICFPVIEGLQPRTDTTFRSKEQDSHHIDTSILEQIPGLDMISSFPLDYMHLICLGVTKKLINNLWLSGKPPYRFSSLQTKAISKEHLALRNQIPNEFSRKPRLLSEIKRWKATELRLFVFYTGPVVLKKYVSENIYQNFMSLYIAVTLLSKNKNIDYAAQLLKYFVKTFSFLYGDENISHNVHNLLHISDDVKIFGSIENFSAFPFENNMLFLKKFLRKGDQPLQQIVNRVAEYKQLSQSNQEKVIFPALKSEHFDGPVIENIIGLKQFKKVYFENFLLSLDEANNCCLMSDKSIVDIHNIISLNGVTTIIGKKYLHIENFYVSPCESSKLDTFLLSEKGPMGSWDLSEVIYKFVKLKFDDKVVVFPLLHTNN